MPKQAAKPRPGRTQSGDTGQRVGAAEFKARCLELMDRVRETGAEYVVTKHGRPVVRIVPYKKSATAPFFGSGKGTVLKYERPLDPLDDEWDVNRD